MVEQMMRAGRLDRAFYTQLIFDSYATGNAVLVVGAVYAAHALIRSLDVPFLLNVLLSGLIGWILLALAAWLIGTKLLEGDAQLQTVIRLTGFAHVPLFAWLLDVLVAPVGLWLGVVWFAAAVYVAVQVAMSLEQREALIASAVGLVVWAVLVAF